MRKQAAIFAAFFCLARAHGKLRKSALPTTRFNYKLRLGVRLGDSNALPADTI
jgi:hypothetical protein